MNLDSTLTIVTYVGASVSFLAAVIALFWKITVEVERSTRKRLTPAGWVLLAIFVIGLLTGLASEVIRLKIKHKEEQSAQKAQQRFVSSMQPLTSLSIHWQLSSADPALWQIMEDGRNAIKENAESTQGGVPESPLEAVEYEAELLPLLSYIARVGPRPSDDELDDDSERKIDKDSIAVLIPLDDAQNAVLSFGRIGSGVSWYKRDQATALSAGFDTTRFRKKARTGDSIPYVSTNLSPTAGGTSTYVIDWDLDPATLANSIDRRNTNVPSTAKLPDVLKIAIFYDIETLPFREGDFANSFATNLWARSDYLTQEIDLKSALKAVELSLAVNGSQEPTYKYRLKRIYRQRMVDQYDDEIGTRCTILEFETS